MAIGLAHTNPKRAALELRNLARGQWTNGMMPHMIYSPKLPYRLEALIWGTGRLSPRLSKTSGITQPPLYAIAVERVAAALPPADREHFVAELLPVLVRFHEWLYRERDPRGTGLPATLHSWECGLDDTPYWTEAMKHLPDPPLRWRWLREYRPVHPEERATPGDLKRMLALGYVLKQYHYDSRQILEHSSVVLEDLVFCAVLAAANESLERLAEMAGTPLPPELHRHFAPTRRALEELWDPGTEQYYSRGYHSGHLIRTPTIATFMPLFAGTASPARAEHLRRLLVGHGYNTAYPVPSVPTTSPHFEAKRYWRGPVWINMNWFVIMGLGRYGFTKEAQALRRHTLELIKHHGFREYYDPLTGEGLGAAEFSWSAALAIDLAAPYHAQG